MRRPLREIARRPFVFMAWKCSCGSIEIRMMTLEPPRKWAGSKGKTEYGTDAEVWRAVGLSRSGLSRFLGTAQRAVGLRGEVEVLLASDATLRRLNRTFRGKDKATDVLSFPAPEEFGGEHAWDLAISLDTARRQAKAYGHSLRDEVRVLLVHGLLHLSGMDHEVDGGEMAEREGLLRARLKLPGGLIERVVVRGKATARARARAKATAFNAKGAKGARKGHDGMRVGA